MQDFNPNTGSGPYATPIYSLKSVNGTLFFRGDDGTHGQQLWTSDGTTTQMLTDFNTVANSGFAQLDLTAIGNKVYFFANESSTTVGLWQTDGTPGNTVMVTDAFPTLAIGQPPQTVTPKLANLIAINSTLYFSVQYNGNGTSTSQAELWSSNGSAGGTSQISPTSLAGPTSLRFRVSSPWATC